MGHHSLPLLSEHQHQEQLATGPDSLPSIITSNVIWDQLAIVSSDVESSLAEIQALLKEEREAEFQAVVGARPRSIVTEMERAS